RLDAMQAGPRAGKAADSLVAALIKATDDATRASLEGGLVTVSRWLNAAGAAKAAASLRKAMGKAKDGSALASLARSLALVAGRLDATQARGHAAKAAESLVEAM